MYILIKYTYIFQLIIFSALLVCVYGRVFTYLRPVDVQAASSALHVQPKIAFDYYHQIPEDEHVDYYVSVNIYEIIIILARE